jgi:O-antigen ligase
MNMDLRRILPTLTLVLYLIAASFGAFMGGMWGGIGIGGALMLFIGTGVIDKHLPAPNQKLVALAVLALGVMACLNLQSTQPDLSWFDWQRLTSIFIPLMLLSSPQILARAHHPRFFPVLTITAFAGALALGIELCCGGFILHLIKGARAQLTDYNRGFSYLVILAFPIMGWLWRTHCKKSLLLFVLVLMIPASLTESRAAKLALIVGLMVIVVAAQWPTIVRHSLMGLSVLFISWPFAAREIFLHAHDWLKKIPPSWQERIEIWDFMSYRIVEKPWLGWGLGASKRLDFAHPHGALYTFVHSTEPHPHDVMTQLWVELGVPGLALGIAFAAVTLHIISKMDKDRVPFALGAWAAAYCLCLVAYNFWTDSLFAAFALTGFAFGF